MRQAAFLATLAALVLLPTACADRGSAASAVVLEKPLIVEKNQGEVRVRRPRRGEPLGLGRAPLIFKVDRQNGGSPDFWFATETLQPGVAIPLHRHLNEDEVLYLGSGTAHVHLGNLERDAHAGAIIFVPRNTWISLRNSGRMPIALLFGFNAPGFDRYLRCRTVLQGSRPSPMTPHDFQQCERIGDVQYR